jgi:MFS family permease
MQEQRQSRETFKRRHFWLGCIICAIGSIFYCYEFVLRILPGALQSQLTAAFGDISATRFGQLSAVYYFAYSPMQLPVGMLMDRFGPRRLLTLACLLCALGSFLFTYSTSLPIAGTGRFLVGFGSSFAFVGVLSLALNWLPRRYFSMVAGLITTLGMLGLIYGEVKLTSMVSTMGLHAALSSVVIFGVVLTVIILFVVRDRPVNTLFAPHPLSEFYKEVWQILTSLKIWLIGLVGACIYTSLSVFGELWGNAYLEHAYSLTTVEAAQTLSALFLGWAVGAPLAGYISDWTGRRIMPLIAGSFCALVCISVILYWPNLSHGSLTIWMCLYGVFSGTEIIVFVMAKENTGAKLSGTVFAVTNMIVTLGGVIFQPLVGKLIDIFSDNPLAGTPHVYRAQDYQIALSILPISLILVIFLALFLKDNPENRS